MTKSKSQVLKEKIITECTAWSVEYMSACMDEMLTQQKSEIIKEIEEMKKDDFYFSCYYCTQDACLDDVIEQLRK